MLPEELWPLVRRHGMEIAAVKGHDSLPDGLNKRENHDRIEAELLANIDAAADNGIAALICFSGNREGKSEEEGLANTVAGLKRVAAAAERKGISLVLELLNSKVNHSDYQCDSTSWGVEVCRRVGSDRVRLLYDIYHMQIMEGDLIRTIADNIGFIAHFHTAGNPGRNDLDEGQEIFYPPIMQAIAATGVRGLRRPRVRPEGGGRRGHAGRLRDLQRIVGPGYPLRLQEPAADQMQFFDRQPTKSRPSPVPPPAKRAPRHSESSQ